MADLWMYPGDVYEAAIDWNKKTILPVGATSLSSVTITVYDPPATEVTPTVLLSSGVDALISYGVLHQVVVGHVYTIKHRAFFNTGEVREKFTTLEVRDPRVQSLPVIAKFPGEVVTIPISWASRLPRGATALGALTPKAFDGADVDVSAVYVNWGQVAGLFSVIQAKGGAGGESRLLEYGQAFDNGRLFHDYAWLTIKVPPA